MEQRLEISFGVPKAIHWSSAISVTYMLLILCEFGLSVGQAQTVTADLPFRPTLIIDPNQLTDNDLSQVVRAFSESKRSEWHSLTVAEPLYIFLANKFGFADGGPYRETALVLTEEIARANGLSDPNRIYMGQELQVPPIPTRPHTQGAKPGLTQAMGIGDNHPTLKSLDAHFKDLLNGTRSGEISTDLRNGATWALTFTQEQAAFFKRHLSAGLLERLISKHLAYYGPTTELVAVQSRGSSGLTAASSAMPQLPRLPDGVDLTTLPAQAAGKLVIFDRFQRGNCGHGSLVAGIVDQVLAAYAPQLRQSVVRAEIDFFADTQASQRVMDSYVNSFNSSPNVRSALAANVKTLLGLKRDQNRPDVVPLFYIQSLFAAHLSSPDTRVASVSVWFREDGYSMLPQDYDGYGQSMVVAAVSDDLGKVEESTTEPEKSFHNQKNYRALLVGAYASDGKAFGEYSQNGSAVCCVGVGDWSATTTCSTPTQPVLGTSYATPQIAAYLYLARAFWSAHNFPVSTTSAARRLMLSSKLNPDWIGRYASAGTPQLPILLTTESSFLATNSLTIQKMVVDPSSSLFVQEDNAHFVHQVGLGCSLQDDVCGIKATQGEVYIFKPQIGRWEHVKNVRMNLKLSTGTVIDTIERLQTYEGVYCL
jgi:hypothetical protein